MKFVIGRALTILSWDDPVTAFFEKVEKLRHSLGRPSRSDFVQFQFCCERGGAMRNRSVVFVIRDKKILMEKLCYEGRTFYSIPGGGIEDDETPEQAAIRELKEECGLDGVIIRKLAEVYNHERTEYSFWVRVPKEQEAIKGYDPEEPVDDQPIKEVRWMNLNEMSEKDRAFMWRYGLLEIPEFCEEVMSWGDTISYPGNDL